MTYNVRDLPWLPEPTSDFRQRCRAISSEEAGKELQSLATFRLNADQAVSFARALTRCQTMGFDLSPLTPLKLGILASATADLLVDEMPAAAARHGVVLQIMLAPYDQIQQQALDQQSSINTGRLDAVLIAVDHRWLQIDAPSLSHSPEQCVEGAVERLTSVVDGLQRYGETTCILQTVPVPPLPLFGNYDRRVQGTVRAMIDAVNARIIALAEASRSHLLDVAVLAERIGTDVWFDPVQWGAYKLPFSASCNGAYADMLGRLLGAMRGKARKCLVLDLDNTVWGGVIGDDGLAGIKVGQGSALGEAFIAIQKHALDLRERGVILAVASKNDDETARIPFREHPDMLLREDHFAVFQANWVEKASNVEAIAKTLKIGVESIVVLDDNPAERAQLRAALPMVAVPELPDDPSWFAWFLASAGYFEALAFVEEDRLRSASYRSDGQRAEVMAKTRNLGDYLRSLEMVMTVDRFDESGSQRICQLINKTNQFNLTTKRYTEVEIAAFLADPSCYTLQVRLRDKYGDMGMIGVIIARTVASATPTWEIDTWLMSCRVLGRKVEDAMLVQLIKDAKASGINRIVGIYRPTPKNSMVKGHYRHLGFSAHDPNGEGRMAFELRLDSYRAPALPIQIVTAAGAEKGGVAA